MRIKWMLLTFVALVAVFASSADAHAQQSPAADVTAMTAVTDELRLIASQPTAADADRASVRAFLERAAVERAAEVNGLDLETVKERASTLSDAEAADLAARIDAMDREAQDRDAQDRDALVGGDVIVISTTAVVIALLVLLLLSMD
jgi:hypothetical protein